MRERKVSHFYRNSFATILVLGLFLFGSWAMADEWKDCRVDWATDIVTDQQKQSQSLQFNEKTGVEGLMFIGQASIFSSQTVPISTNLHTYPELVRWDCSRSAALGNAIFNCLPTKNSRRLHSQSVMVYNDELNYGYIYTHKWAREEPYKILDFGSMEYKLEYKDRISQAFEFSCRTREPAPLNLLESMIVPRVVNELVTFF